MRETREAGQSAASAEALNAYLEASYKTSDARGEVRQLLRQLREARAAVKAAEAAEKAAEQNYLDTPYAEETS